MNRNGMKMNGTFNSITLAFLALAFANDTPVMLYCVSL